MTPLIPTGVFFFFGGENYYHIIMTIITAVTIAEAAAVENDGGGRGIGFCIFHHEIFFPQPSPLPKKTTKKNKNLQ